MMRSLTPLLSLSLVSLMLGACNAAHHSQDYRIQVVPSFDGRGHVALPPECPDWQVQNGPLSNQLMPQIGCATARNLAAQIDNPNDLIEGKPLGAPDSYVAASSIAAYRAGKTKALIDPNADAPRTDSSTGAGIVQ